jgi:p-cumate 2,3-dioxygenase beta subunit
MTITPTAAAPAAVSTLSELDRAQVEDFLYHEAALLDAWNLDQWFALFDTSLRYVVPCNDTPDGDPARDLVLIDDDELRLRLRVERLNSRKAHREYPHSRTSHQVYNVRLGKIETCDSETSDSATGDSENGSTAEPVLPVEALFTVWRFRAGKANYYVGRYRYRLVLRDGELRIRHKRCELDMTVLRPAGDLAIIL